MTPHYDLKRQEKNNGVLGAGLGGGHKHFCHISRRGVEYVFPTGLGGRQNFCLPHENITAPPPTHTHLVINDSSLKL